MNNHKLDIEQATQHINKTAGEDWGAPRSRIYIAALVASLRQTVDRLEKELYLETEVNKRVRDMLGLVK